MKQEEIVHIKGTVLSKPVMSKMLQEIDCCEFVLLADLDEQSHNDSSSRTYIVTEIGKHSHVTHRVLDEESRCEVKGIINGSLVVNYDFADFSSVDRVLAKSVNYLK